MFVSKSVKMETIPDQSRAYVIETIKSETSELKPTVLLDSSKLIRPSNASKQIYGSPISQNRKILLSGVDNVAGARLSKKKMASNHPMNQKPVVLNPTLKTPRKKLSYETEFKPSIPSTKGSYKGFIRYGRRQLIVDQQIMISTKHFKGQLNYTGDIISARDFAPRSKVAMHRLLNGITKIFAYPAHRMPSSQLLQLYVANCTSKELSNVEAITDMELLPLGYQRSINASIIKKNSRKRKSPYTKAQLSEIIERKMKNTEVEILVEAANSANDHRYSKEIIEYIDVTSQLEENTDEEPMIDEPCVKDEIDIGLQNDDVIKVEENDIFTIKSDEMYTLKSENGEDERQIVIIQRLGENIALSQKNLEALLAAANGSDQSNQVVAICNSSEFGDGNRFILVQNEENEEILGTESEMILSN